MKAFNIFSNIPSKLPQELIESLVSSPHVKIERIVSRGHCSLDDFRMDDIWYDQDWNEWVLLIKGSAELEFEGQDTPLQLKPGDYLLIPAHCKHRVLSTALDQDTVWLAIHYNH